MAEKESSRTITSDDFSIPSEWKDVKFPFENIILEGGAAKGISYIGTAQVLQECGILSKLRRFGGTSVGAVYATMMALGYEPKEMIERVDPKAMAHLEDARWGFLSLMPNMLRSYGWHPGKYATINMREILERKTGDPDLTFWKLYKDYGKELCIVSTNVTKRRLDYHHPKTSPDMSIALAIRMSLSIPVLLQPVEHKIEGQVTEYHMDGAVLCNYPIFCFDGWYLSMDSKNSLLRKATCTDKPFDGFNEKTIGALVYSSEEYEVMQDEFTRRLHGHTTELPNTNLALSNRKRIDEYLSMTRNRVDIQRALVSFLSAIDNCPQNEKGEMSVTVLKDELIKSGMLETEDGSVVFKDKTNINDVMSLLNPDAEDEILLEDITHALQKLGVSTDVLFPGPLPREIPSFGEFLSAVLDTIDVHSKRNSLKERDVDRTIGIDTVYINGQEKEYAEGDINFMIQQGRIATVAFLQSYLKM